MQFISRVSLVTALGALALPAAAQDFSGVMTLGYGNSSIDGVEEDISNLSLDGRVKGDFGNGFSMGARLSLNRVEIDEVDDSIDVSMIGVTGAYRTPLGLSIGAYAEQADLSTDLLGEDLTLTSYGVMLGYSLVGVDMAAFVGMSETDPELPDDVDIMDYGIVAHYRIGERGIFGGSILVTNIDVGGTDLGIGVAGLAGSYAINDDWMVFAGAADASIGDLDVDATTLGIGVAYDLGNATGFNALVSLELARTRFDYGPDDVDDDTVRVGLTIPFGKGGAAAPLNSVADAVLNPTHSAATSAVLGVF